MADGGWIKAHRRMLRSRVFQNEKLFKVFMWCLLKASSRERWVSVSTGRATTEVRLHPGQFIFGRDSAARELKMKSSSAWDRMQKLKKLQNVDIESNSKYSVVTVCNWSTYQERKKRVRQRKQQPSDRQATAKQQPSDTNKNVEEGNKNVEEETTSVVSLAAPQPPRDEVASRAIRSNVAMIPIPDSLDTPEFKNEWIRWTDYLHERGFVSQDTLMTQIVLFATHGPAASIASIRQSIQSSWKFLKFEDGKISNGNRPRSTHNTGSAPGTAGIGRL